MRPLAARDPGYHARLEITVQPLVGMELSDLEQALGPSQSRFRAKQIYTALYRQKVDDLVQISTLPSALRSELAVEHGVGLPAVERRYDSIDGTRRYLLRLEDGRTVETVLMPEESRDTVCISSQVGCPVDCKFCMTALMGLERNLTAGEIVGQVLFIAREHALLNNSQPSEHRHDGDGRAAAEPSQCAQGNAHPV